MPQQILISPPGTFVPAGVLPGGPRRRLADQRRRADATEITDTLGRDELCVAAGALGVTAASLLGQPLGCLFGLLSLTTGLGSARRLGRSLAQREPPSLEAMARPRLAYSSHAFALGLAAQGTGLALLLRGLVQARPSEESSGWLLWLAGACVSDNASYNVLHNEALAVRGYPEALKHAAAGRAPVPFVVGNDLSFALPLLAGLYLADGLARGDAGDVSVALTLLMAAAVSLGSEAHAGPGQLSLSSHDIFYQGALRPFAICATSYLVRSQSASTLGNDGITVTALLLLIHACSHVGMRRLGLVGSVEAEFY